MLIQGCKEGADAGHPYGASSVKASSTNAFRSFEQVINAYNASGNFDHIAALNCRDVEPAQHLDGNG